MIFAYLDSILVPTSIHILNIFICCKVMQDIFKCRKVTLDILVLECYASWIYKGRIVMLHIYKLSKAMLEIFKCRNFMPAGYL